MNHKHVIIFEAHCSTHNWRRGVKLCWLLSSITSFQIIKTEQWASKRNEKRLLGRFWEQYALWNYMKLCEITFTIVNESLTSFLIMRPSSKLFKTFLKEKWNKRLLGYGDQHHSWSWKQNIRLPGTGKSLSEALIFASINTQYDKRLFIDLPV